MAQWHFNKRFIVSVRVLIIMIGMLALVYAFPALVLRIPSVQRWVGARVSTELSALLDAPVDIERVSMDGWQALELQHVTILDATHRPALSVRELIAGISLWEFVSQEGIRINSIRAFDLKLNLHKDSQSGHLNIQNILDALRSDPSTPALTLAVHSILIRSAQISYSEDEVQRLGIARLDLQISRIISRESGVEGFVDDLRLETDKGFRINHLGAQIALSNEQLSIAQLLCELPHSRIAIPTLRYDLAAPLWSGLHALEIDECTLAMDDLMGLYAPLSHWSGETLRVAGEFLPHRHGLDVSDLRLSIGELLSMEAQIALRTTESSDLSEVNVLTRSLRIDPVRLLPILSHFPELNSPALSETISALGTVSYQGETIWAPKQHLLVQGLCATELGRWAVKSQLYWSDSSTLSNATIQVSTPGFDLAPLTRPALTLGRVSGEVKLDLDFSPQGQLPIGVGRAELSHVTFGGHTYEQLYVDLRSAHPGQYALKLRSNDPTATISAETSFSLNQSGLTNIRLDLERADIFPNKILPLAFKTIDRVRLAGNIALSSLDPNLAVGHIHVPSLSLWHRSGERLELDSLSATITEEDAARHMSLSAPWLQADLTGSFAIEQLPKLLLRSLYQQVPSLRSLAPQPTQVKAPPAWASLSATVDSLPSALIRILDLPIEVIRHTELRAHYRQATHETTLHLRSNRLHLAGYKLNNVAVDLSNTQLTAMGDIETAGGERFVGTRFALNQQHDSIQLGLSLGQATDGSDNGYIGLSVHIQPLVNAPRSLTDFGAIVSVHPSHLRIHTSQWAIAPAEIAFAKEYIHVKGLEMKTSDRGIRLSGGVGTLASAPLRAEVERINLRYILETLGVDLDLLDTDLTGQLEAQLHDGILKASGRVISPGFYVLGHNTGAIDVALDWSSDDLLIRLDGDVHQAHGGRSAVSGWIKPADGAGIDLTFDAHNLDVSFVGRFLSDIFNRVGGYGTGQMRLHGLFEDGVSVSGVADIRDGTLGLPVLGTEYTFDHRIKLEDDRVLFDGIRVRDDEGHSAIVQGEIRHQYFDHFDINLRADEMKHLKVLQTSSPKDMPVYGKAYGSGYATMIGDENKLQIDVNLRSEAGTDVVLDFNPTTAGRDESLMTFTNLRHDSTTQAPGAPTIAPTTPSILDLDLNLTITPEARLGMQISTDTSSDLRGHAEGTLRIQAPSLGDAEVFGTLSVLDGSYTFRFEQLAHKRFAIREGGQLLFRGDPMTAQIDLDAVYSLTANISDLDESLSTMTGRTNIPVHCILSLGGHVVRPDIKFGLELPGVDRDIERRIHALINTEDAMLRQMLYLMTLGKFYSEESVSRATKATDNWTAAASSAISEQLSSLLGNLSKTVSLGTSIRTRNTAFEDTDIELLFSARLFGDRLLINGNIGYHDNPYLNNTYLGEFDLEYKLTRMGSLRLKAYNRYNSLYQYLRQSLMTQGVGLLFRQRFDRITDLWRRPKQSEPRDSIPRQ